MSNDQNHVRQTKGTSIGGQFAPKVNPEATLDLAAEIDLDSITIFMVDRIDVLQSHCFVPATTAPLMFDPRSSAHRKEWWDRNTVVGEFNHLDWVNNGCDCAGHA
jgi:hypothetical protein